MDRFSLPDKYLHQIREVNIRYKNVDAILELEAIVGNRPYGIELWRVSNSTIAISPNRSWFFHH
jgi:hypothetical protein